METSFSDLPVPCLLTITEQVKEKPCKLLELPDNLLIHLMEYLSLTSVMQLATTCKKLNSLSAKSVLWGRLDLQEAYLQPGKLGYLLKRNPRYMRLARAKILEPQIIEIPFDGTALQLTHLDLTSTEISRSTMSQLVGACENLKKLCLEGLVLGVDIFGNISPKLQVLHMGMTSNVHLPGLVEYLQSANDLNILNIGWIQQAWTPIQLMEIIRSLPSGIVQLNISGYPRLFSNLHIAALVDQCQLLEKLDLSDNYNMTATSMIYILRLKKLKCLAINRCLRIGLVALGPLRYMDEFQFIEMQGFSSDICPTKKIREWLRLNVNCQPFLNIGRPTSESNPSYIWRRLVYTLNRD